PLLAKLMPEVISQMNIEGMTITMPEPTALDSYIQFFKNITQMGLIVLVLIFSGVLTQELSKGTIVILLTKGLTRTTVILSKYIIACLLYSLALILAFATTYGYTLYLFPSDSIVHLGYSVGCLWLFGLFLLSLLMLAQTIVDSQYGNLLLVSLVIGILFILNLFPICQKFNPLALVSYNVPMLVADFDFSQLIPAVWITGLLTIGCLSGAIMLFKTYRFK
ncbi:MAG: ABC transporter permease subunit, partial [Turicibacter sp.]